MDAVSTVDRQDRVRAAVVATTKALAIVITFAFLYWAVSMMNPTLAKSIGEPFGVTFRFANALRAFMLPYGGPALVGAAVGAQAFNVTSGTSGLFAVDLMPFITLLIGLLMLMVSRAWGRAWYKDLTVLALYGALAGAAVALRLSGVAMVLAPDTYKPVLEWLFLFKVVSSAGIYMLGYPIIMAWEKMRHGKSGTA